MSVVPLAKAVYDTPDFRNVKYHPRGRTVHPVSLKSTFACQHYINSIPYHQRPSLRDSILKTPHLTDLDAGPSGLRISVSKTANRRQPDDISQPADILVQPPDSPRSLARSVTFDKGTLAKYCSASQHTFEDGGLEEEARGHTSWQEYEIPNELGLLPPDVPHEIRDIVQESLDESRALRLSELHAQSPVGSKTIGAGHRDGGNELVIAESSAMASRRHEVSPDLGAHLPPSDIWIDFTSSLESNSAIAAVESQEKYCDISNAGKNDRRPKAHGAMSGGPRFFKRLRRLKAHQVVSLQTQAHVEGKGKASLKSTGKLHKALEPETYECIGCFDDISKNNIIRAPCRHQYCKACFSRLINNSIQNEQQFPPKCCLLEIPRALVKRHLLETELTAFDEKALEYSVAIGSRYYCARPECTKWIDTKRAKMHDSALQCPHCSFKMCTLCRGLEHGTGQDCPEDFGLNATLKQAEREGWRRCYNCRAMVELNRGCRHITCRCKAEFW